MKKLFILTILGLITSFSSFALFPITGTFGVCAGSSTTVDDSLSPGGTWSSSNSLIASITPFGAMCEVTGVSAGVATITYTLGGAYVTASFTVSPSPAAITGSASACVGASSTLTDVTAGGSWISFNPAIASVDAMTGVVTGVSGGSTTIEYIMGTGCHVATAYVVGGLSVLPIFGAGSVCVGSTITLYDSTAGGVWSSGSTGIATISAGGVVTGVSSGSVIITYSLSGGSCGASAVYRTVTVGGSTSAGTISGLSTVVAGSSITLTDGVTGGTWSSSSTAIAVVGPTGVVNGVSAGTVTITYTASACGGTATATKTITVTAFDGISGNINFSGGYHGGVKVWLITYDTATHILAAIDSTVVISTGPSAYYQFTGVGTDSFRVKAAVDTAYYSSGYVPTYHTSYFYWSDADVIAHVSGTADINKDINMSTGTTTSGPGFIGGDVLTGANKGTSDGVPVAGLLVYVVNATSGNIVQQTYTDAAGTYSFSNLPYGTYLVHPEFINYATVPYTGITISSSSHSVSTASFIEHTVSKTITPVGTGVTNFALTTASVTAFPNPTTGKLNIAWKETANETGKVSITDITGREIYKTALNMTEGSGMKQVDLSALMDGLYIITVKSGNINYTNKILLQH